MKGSWFVAILGDQRYALPAAQITEVVRAVRLARVPQAPAALLGALLFRGHPLPVVDIRARLGAKARPLSPDDYLLIGVVGDRRGAIVAEEVVGLTLLDPTEGSLQDVPTPAYVLATVADAEGHSVVLLDLERILSAPEASEIAEAMRQLEDSP